MKARPILMHARSIENLLAGRKTQTRRIIKPQPDGQMFPRDGKSFWMPGAFSSQREPVACPYGGPGDLLWVRERHSFNEPMKSSAGGDDTHWIVGVEYSDGSEKPMRFDRKPTKTRQRGELGWLPSIHMPRRLSRLTLRIVDVRVERVQDIGVVSAEQEGVFLNQDGYWDSGIKPPAGEEYCALYRRTSTAAFKDLWEHT